MPAKPFSRNASPSRPSSRSALRSEAIISRANISSSRHLRGGGLIREAWFKRYEPSELPERLDQIIQSWDTANSPSELADYSVCATWGLKGPNFYLINVLRKKLVYPDLKRAVHE